MNNLVIYPTFLCPFSCQYCLFKNKLSYNQILDLDLLQSFLNENINHFDSIIVSGGDTLSLDKSYILSFYDLLKSYNKPITLKAYPYNRYNIPKDVNYDFSYDFLAKPRAMECWDTLITFKEKFKITITLSPLLFKYHPNNLLKKLSQLPNLTEVEFAPYCKNMNNQYDITKNNSFVKMNEFIINTQLKLPFKITNIEKLKAIKNGEYIENTEIHLFPDCKPYIQYFDKDILLFKEFDNNYNCVKPLIYPDNIDMYAERYQKLIKN